MVTFLEEFPMNFLRILFLTDSSEILENSPELVPKMIDFCGITVLNNDLLFTIVEDDHRLTIIKDNPSLTIIKTTIHERLLKKGGDRKSTLRTQFFTPGTNVFLNKV